MGVHNPFAERDDCLRYLWWLSAPMFLLFEAFSFTTGGGELNWPVTAYLSGLVLAGVWLARQFDSPGVWYRRLGQGKLTLAWAAGLLWVHLLLKSRRESPLFT